MPKDKGGKGVVKEVKDNLGEINITKGMARAMSGSTCVCPNTGCNLNIPKYRGRYPQKCPECGTILVYKTGGEYTTKEV